MHLTANVMVRKVWYVTSHQQKEHANVPASTHIEEPMDYVYTIKVLVIFIVTIYIYKPPSEYFIYLFSFIILILRISGHLFSLGVKIVIEK